MTRLTLYWHLRTIVEGVPEVEATLVDEENSERDYSKDYYSTGSGEYTPKDGRVNDSYDSTLAIDALNSEDFVAYLDAVSHDPCVPMHWRFEASELLSTHIYERRLISTEEKRGIPPGQSTEEAELRNAFVNSDLPKKSMRPGHWDPVQCPNCGEGECLFDVDRPDEPNHCTVCGTQVPLPSYPESA